MSAERGPCPCGCGAQTLIASRNRKDRDWIKGQPRPHDSRRNSPVDYIVDAEMGCWVWQGAHDGTGYGRLNRSGRWTAAHRWYYEKLRGPIPDGLTLDHLCRNRACVNPGHLEPVTHAENCRRGHAALPKVHPRERAKILDLHAAGVSCVEIGRRLGIKSGTIWMRIRRWSEPA